MPWRGLGIGRAACLATALVAACGGSANVGPAPNVVLLVADDLGWNDVGYHGSEIRTPHIDRFVAEGVELDRFYVTPLCSPTRAGLLTGRYPQRYGLRDGVIAPWHRYGLDAGETLLPELLAPAGYARRALIGKWHLGHGAPEQHPLRRGFTSFYGNYNGAIDYFSHVREGEVDWHRGFEPVAEEGYVTGLLAAEAERFIADAAAGDAPFFLFLSFTAPHLPLQAEPGDLAAYADLSGRFEDEPAGEYGAQGRGAGPRQTYAAMVAALDLAIGRVLAALEQAGVADDTLVWFSSDNGSNEIGGSNDPLRGGKETPWEGGVRVPAAVRWPARLGGGRRLAEPLAYVDVLPTLCAAAGASTRSLALDGIDAIGVLAGEEARARTLDLGPGAVVSRDWKLVEGRLFRINEDPDERRDVRHEHPDVARRLEERAREFDALADGEPVPAYGVGREGFVPPARWRIPGGPGD